MVPLFVYGASIFVNGASNFVNIISIFLNGAAAFSKGAYNLSAVWEQFSVDLTEEDWGPVSTSKMASSALRQLC